MIERWFREGWLGGRVELAEELFATDVTIYSAAGTAIGRETIQAGVRELYQGLRGLDGEFEIVRGASEYVVRFVVRGKHMRPMYGIPPSGACVEVAGVATVRVRGGLIAEVWQTCSMREPVAAPGQGARERSSSVPWVQRWQLTPREASVALLAIQGAADKEIGAQLQLATASVSKYLGRVLRKSGSRTRTELAERARVIQIG